MDNIILERIEELRDQLNEKSIDLEIAIARVRELEGQVARLKLLAEKNSSMREELKRLKRGREKIADALK